MWSRVALAIPLTLFALAVDVPSANAMWLQDGVTVAAAGVGDQYQAEVTSDGEGGAIVVWSQNRPGTGTDIMAQRLDAWGRPLWGNGGVVLCGANLDQTVPQVVGDGAGGAIAVWEDARNADKDIYAQRVNGQGVTLWAADGVGVCVLATFQQAPQIARDGGNGAIITWEDSRPSPSGWDIYAQRISGSGTVQWVPNGNLVCGDANGQFRPQITSDGAGGAVIAWEHEVTFQLDVRAQRIHSSGSVLWGVGFQGIVVCANGLAQDQITITGGVGGGAIIAWRDQRTGAFNPTIFAQRVDALGNPAWTADGVDICTATGPEQSPRIVSDGANGAIVSWSDTRLGGGEAYVQRINFFGVRQWTPTGVLVSDDVSESLAPRLAADGIGGAVVAWLDLRYQSNGDIFARRVNAAGLPQGPVGGVAMGLAPGFKTVASIASDGAGGAVVAWSDSRNPSRVLAQAQRLDRFNNWGYPSADVDVHDIPGDQGGVVNVTWDASRLDPWPSESIDRYTVWRAVEDNAALNLATAGAPVTALENLDPKATDALRVETVANVTYYWQLMATVDAFHLSGYAQTVATLFDSTATSPDNHYFQVVAHGLTPQEYWVSAPAAGKSFDNLAPAAPILLTAHWSGADVVLDWSPSQIPAFDFHRYAVYRATNSGVTPIPGAFLGNTVDTMLVDTNAPSGAVYYIVTAVDTHGNQSVPSNEATVSNPTAIGDTPSLTHLTLDANFPNPFSHATELRVGLPRDADVHLVVYDVAGRRVATRSLSRLAAGWQRVLFDGRDDRGSSLASGVYFARVVAAGETQTMKMVIQR